MRWGLKLNCFWRMLQIVSGWWVRLRLVRRASCWLTPIIIKGDNHEPSKSGRYYFLDAKDAFRPYVGAGVIYTAFNSLTLNTAGQGLAPTGASIDSAWGWVASLGANYELNSNYFLTGSLSYTYTTTTLHINNLVNYPAPAGPASTTNLKLGNTLVFLGAGYRF